MNRLLELSDRARRGWLESWPARAVEERKIAELRNGTFRGPEPQSRSQGFAADAAPTTGISHLNNTSKTSEFEIK